MAEVLIFIVFVSSYLLHRWETKQESAAPPAKTRRMTLQDKVAEDNGLITLKPIGLVRSIYRLCVGTPRQGLLVPHSRGVIELDGSVDAVDGLEAFSHLWVVFVFHLNTQSRRGVPAKIAPPALGGKKVGHLATRSPHRTNPIGLTLCKLEQITRHGNKTWIRVSGIDLVDGTPVLDLKPYVSHYDSVSCEPPAWVRDGLASQRTVEIRAQNELEQILTQHPKALAFYGMHQGDGSLRNTVDIVSSCIAEVLRVDVRSGWQTKKARAGRFQAERASRISTEQESSQQQCTQQLDNLLIHYTVEKPDQHKRSESEGSGSEDKVVVHSIQYMPNTVDAVPAVTESATPAVPPESDPTPDEQQQQQQQQEDEPKAKEDVLTEQVPSETSPIVAAAPLEEEPKQQDEEPPIPEEPLEEEPRMQALSEEQPVSHKEEGPQSQTVSEEPPASSLLSDQDEERKASLRHVAFEPKAHPRLRVPIDGDYQTLQSFWSKAASINTPTGVNPETVKSPAASKKYFAMSDRPYSVRNSQLQKDDEYEASRGEHTSET